MSRPAPSGSAAPSATAAPAGRRLRGGLLAAVLLVFGAALLTAARQPAPADFLPDRAPVAAVVPTPASCPAGQAAPPAQAGCGFFEVGVMPNADFVEGHAVSLVELSDGRIRAFWMSGNEGSPDAVVASAVFDRTSHRWGPAQPVVGVQALRPALHRYVKRIGNPVSYQVPGGDLLLFFVNVSIGGWAGSSVSLLRSADGGVTWGPARRLITSPFLNVSTMVRNAPIRYADGRFGLPVYHDFQNKRAELLRLDNAGTVLDLTRLSAGYPALQPSVLVRSPTQALSLMRNPQDGMPRYLIEGRTQDAGRTWQTSTMARQPNPGSPASGIVLPDGRLLVVLNDAPSQRRALSMMASNDGGASWRSVRVLEDESARPPESFSRDGYAAAVRSLGPALGVPADRLGTFTEAVVVAKCNPEPEHGCDFEFAYPFLLRASAGDYFISYTWNRIFLRTIRFDQAWLDRELDRVFADVAN